MKIADHWLSEARRIPSPNFDARPEGETVSLIVIHCISLPPGRFGDDSIHRLFTNRLDPRDHPYFRSIHQLRVSAHVLIDRQENLTQYVPFDARAWHAGESRYQGRSRCNDYSIGIELEGTESVPYTDRQYETLARLAAALIRHYPTLSPDRITGHSNIAPGRKQDPGPSFDWKKFWRLLQQASETG